MHENVGWIVVGLSKLAGVLIVDSGAWRVLLMLGALGFLWNGVRGRPSQTTDVELIELVHERIAASEELTVDAVRACRGELAALRQRLDGGA